MMVTKKIKRKIACVGSGVIGAGWIARFVENGYEVSVFDIDPNNEEKVKATLDNASYAYDNLISFPNLKKGSVKFESSISAAVCNSDLIIESVPERLKIKQQVYMEIENFCDPSSLITSSTSGILPSELQSKMKNPERFFVAHPFNPVYLIPLVEIVGGKETSKNTIKKALKVYKNLGMHPVHLKKEIEAFVADRLLEAIWRESLWLIKDGICSTKELDDIVRLGFGLRYAQMGVFDTYRIAGGKAGMRHFIEQFGPCLKWPWTKLTDVPELTSDLVNLIATQSDDQSGHYSINQMEKLRDSNLVEIQKALQANNWGAGKILKKYEKKRRKQLRRLTLNILHLEKPINTFVSKVPKNWVDYNGHMNEARYLDCFCSATDNFMELIGCDKDYVKNGNSYFTVETHIRHLDEIKIGETITVATQLLSENAKKLHLFHQIFNKENKVMATGEHLLIHVSLKTRKASEPETNVKEKLQKIFDYHAELPSPDGKGRSVNMSYTEY